MNTTKTNVVSIDRDEATHALKLAKGTAIASFVPTDFNGLMQVSDLMSRSGTAIAKHCRNNPGACLSIAMVAYQNGFNPWLLANDSYVVNDQVAYGGKSIIAMVNNAPNLVGRLKYEFSGKWPDRVVKVRGTIKGEPEELTITCYAATITVRNSPNWKQQPDQQLRYVAGRMWGRAHMPEVTLGLLADDEVTDLEQAKDGTYQPAVAKPSRSDFQAPAPEPVEDAEIGPVFDLIDHVGEVVEQNLSPAEFIDAYLGRIGKLKDQQAIVTLVENNHDAIDQIGKDGLVDDVKSIVANAEKAAIKAQPKPKAEPVPAEKDLIVTGEDANDFKFNLIDAFKGDTKTAVIMARQKANQASIDRLKGDDRAAWDEVIEAITNAYSDANDEEQGA